MTGPLTQKELNKGLCEVEGCTEDHSILHLRAKCHPHAAVDVRYVKETGELEFRCHRCMGRVVEVKVAEE